MQTRLGQHAGDGSYTGARGEQLPSNQLPLAAIAPSAENDEWWTVSTSADGSLDVSAFLQEAFLCRDTGRGVAEANGVSIAQYNQ